MAQNVTIAGASYSDVPSIEVPKTGGGTASFIDTTIASNAASASDIASGKMAWVNGALITGSGSGGGGGGITQDQDGYLVLDSQGGGGGGGPDLSHDTVTAATLLVGETAHNASGQAITGELVGTDFFGGSLTISYDLEGSTAVHGLLYWNSTSKKLASGVTLSAGTSERTFAIPTGNFFVSIPNPSNRPVAISNTSSGVTILNNGDPVLVSGTTYQYVIRINGSSTTPRSFTVSKVSEIWETVFDGSVSNVSDSPYNYFWVAALSDVYPTIGSSWRITIDGVANTLTAYDMGNNVVGIGNPLYSGGTDDGSGIQYNWANQGWGAWVGDNALTVASHTIKIERLVTA